VYSVFDDIGMFWSILSVNIIRKLISAYTIKEKKNIYIFIGWAKSRYTVYS